MCGIGCSTVCFNTFVFIISDSVDKRGRALQHDSSEDLRKYYQLSDEETPDAHTSNNEIISGTGKSNPNERKTPVTEKSSDEETPVIEKSSDEETPITENSSDEETPVTENSSDKETPDNHSSDEVFSDEETNAEVCASVCVVCV